MDKKLPVWVRAQDNYAGKVELEHDVDIPTWIVDSSVSKELLSDLYREEKFDMLLDLCGVDYPGREKRFDVVYHLYSFSTGKRLRVKVPVSEDRCEVDSVVDIWKAADWFEREAYDMFGIKFKGHPALRRILTHEGFVGHPLRKDYDPGKRWQLEEDKIYKPVFLNLPPEEDSMFERMTINIGPSHPAMHGTFRLMAVLEGEVIVDSDVEIGYLHRCFEKMAETHPWQQVVPYTDRLNYCSAFINNVAYCKTVEDMLGLELPPKAIWGRMVLMELSRIMDHCVCNGTTLVDVGALTNFWYFFEIREEIYSLLTKCFGSRLTVAGCRIGGFQHDLPPDFIDLCKHLLEIIPPLIEDIDKLVTHNRIWLDRSVGISAISGKEAINWGWTGPCLRASGVQFDLRKNEPYYWYDKVDFDIPVFYGGDVYDRYRVRMAEIKESLKIVRQLVEQGIPDGPYAVDDYHVMLPPKDMVYNQMESMIYHFKLIFEGMRVPPGERYGYLEGANGELGFYIVSDGSPNPYRIKVRPPCFPIFSTFSRLIRNQTVADAIITLGGLNIIAGELER